MKCIGIAVHPLPLGEGKDPIPSLSPRERGRSQGSDRCVQQKLWDTLSPDEEGCRGGRPKEDGYRLTYLPVDRDGLLKLVDLESAISDQTAVVSLMWANNETGVLFPVDRIAEICRSRGVLYHCDAVQAAGKVEIDVQKVPADYLSLTGHKFHAPKGIGALYVRRKAPFSPLVYGGHQERNRRGGTENVPLIVGMGKAAELARQHLPDYDKKVRPLRDELEEGILSSIPDTELNGHKGQRLANTTNITFHGIESEALLTLLDKEGICASSGSACLADSDEPSHVIKAMKSQSAASRQMIRFSLGTDTAVEQVHAVISVGARLVLALLEK
jgi:cysteine desulfurase